MSALRIRYKFHINISIDVAVFKWNKKRNWECTVTTMLHWYRQHIAENYKLLYWNSDILQCLPRVHSKGRMVFVCTACFCEVKSFFFFLINRFSSVGRLLHYPDDVREIETARFTCQIDGSTLYQTPWFFFFTNNNWRMQWNWNRKGIISVRYAVNAFSCPARC